MESERGEWAIDPDEGESASPSVSSVSDTERERCRPVRRLSRVRGGC